MKELYSYRAAVVKVTDGDSVTLLVDLGFHVTLEIRTRLLGINAPELITSTGKAARAFLREKLPDGAEVRVRTYRDPGDKYGRWLAEIYRGDVFINELMLTEGHATRYKDA